MRFLLKFMLLVGVHKELDFFALYDEGFLLIRCNSLEAAFAYMKGAAPIDAVLPRGRPRSPTGHRILQRD